VNSPLVNFKRYSMKNKVCIISGATATGKSSLAIKVAKLWGAEIINFDSLLFYHELSVGTAKPTIKELAEVPHHMINITSAKTPLNAARFQEIALPLVQNILNNNKLPILVGGSGFYLQALLKGMYQSVTTSEEVIKKSELLYMQNGIAPFIEELKKNDLSSLNQYHENDHYRIRRAVEHFWTTGKPFSMARTLKESNNIDSNIHNWQLHHIYLSVDKIKHWEIIKDRTNQMLKNGLIEEVQNLLKIGFTGEEKPLLSIGYKETQDFLKGNIKDMLELEERINISTRQLAKSQRTWFNKDESKTTYNILTEELRIFADITKFLNCETT
jgi:tRNA dimethylallyltransferase